MIFAIFFPALAGVVVWWFFGSKENRAMRAKLNCGALAIELATVITLCFAQGSTFCKYALAKLLEIRYNKQNR